MSRKRPNGKRGPCVFCGEVRELDREHILANWLNDVLGIRGTKRHLRLTPRPGHPFPYHRRATGLDSRVRGVCKPCNSGWMSRLEKEGGKPELLPLVHGIPHRLDLQAQRRLAAWATKTALVTQAENPRRVKSHFEAMFALQHPPPNAEVWIGAYREGVLEDLSGFYHHDLWLIANPEGLTAVDVPAEPPDFVNGYGTTLVIRHVLFQVVGTEPSIKIERTLKGVLGGALTKIWPAVRPVPWPPRIIVDEANLGAVADSVVPGVIPTDPPPEAEVLWKPAPPEAA